ncbi:MAG: sulfatase-like hydrolase/transferase [Planctomycetota bacterium]
MTVSESLLVFLGLVATSCGTPERPNVLLITVDTTRADALDPSGPHAHLSPNIGAVAADAVYYANAHTVAPITLPSHASMLTGLVPPRHSVRLNGAASLPDEAVTLAELARGAGYQTSAFVAAVVLNSEYGLAQGFEHYGELGAIGPEESLYYAERPANEVVDETKHWLAARDRERPFMTWVHVFDAHMPYQPPLEHFTAAGGDPYLGEVAFLDTELGRLFDALQREGVWDDTVVLLIADHGEGRGDHGEATHGPLGFESTLHVPMLLRDPRTDRRGRSRAPVSVVDVFPTLARVMGTTVPGSIDGLDLGAGDPPSDRGIYFESYFGTHSYGWAPLAGWIQDGWKLVQTSECELYHLAQDPIEQNNLIEAPGMEPKLRELRRALAAVFELDSLDATAAETQAEVLGQLAGLGYVGMERAASEFPSPFLPSTQPAPHSQIENLAAFQRAQVLSETKRHAEAVAILEPLVERAPFNGAAWRILSGELIHLERYDDALSAARKNMELHGDWWGANLNIGIALEGLGQADGAIPYYERAVAKNGELDWVLSRLGGLHLERGDRQKAAEYLGILRKNLESRGEWPPKGDTLERSVARPRGEQH